MVALLGCDEGRKDNAVSETPNPLIRDVAWYQMCQDCHLSNGGQNKQRLVWSLISNLMVNRLFGFKWLSKLNQGQSWGYGLEILN